MVSVLALNAGFLNDSLFGKLLFCQKAFKILAQWQNEFIAVPPKIIFDVVFLVKLNKKFVGVFVVVRQIKSSPFFVYDIMKKKLLQVA